MALFLKKCMLNNLLVLKMKPFLIMFLSCQKLYIVWNKFQELSMKNLALLCSDSYIKILISYDLKVLYFFQTMNIFEPYCKVMTLLNLLWYIIMFKMFLMANKFWSTFALITYILWSFWIIQFFFLQKIYFQSERSKLTRIICLYAFNSLYKTKAFLKYWLAIIKKEEIVSSNTL